MKDIPTLGLKFWTRYSVEDWSIARSILKTLFDHGSPFSPETYDAGRGRRRVRLTRDSLESVSENWIRMPIPGLLMHRTKPCETIITIGGSMAINISGRSFNTFGISIDKSWFVDDDRVFSFVALAKNLYSVLHACYGCIHETTDSIEQSKYVDPELGQVFAGVDLFECLPGVYWANFFGPEYVEMFGRERLFNAPAHSVEELPDGGALILTSASPLEPASPESRADQNRLREYLGTRAFDRNAAPSERLVPHFRDWPRSSVPAPTSIDVQATRQDQSEISYHQAIRQLHGILYDRDLVLARLRKRAGRTAKNLDGSPQGLVELDEFLDRERRRQRGQIDPELAAKAAAYFGNTIVDNLHGQWVFSDPHDEPRVELTALTGSTLAISPLARVHKLWVEGLSADLTSLYVVLERMVMGTKREEQG